MKVIRSVSDRIIVIKKGKIVFPGFKNLNTFKESLRKLGAKKIDIEELVANLEKYRGNMNIFKNSILQGKNLNVAPAEFNNIMNDRFKNFLSTEYMRRILYICPP